MLKKRRAGGKIKHRPPQKPEFLYCESVTPGSLRDYARRYIENLVMLNFTESTVSTRANGLTTFIEWSRERSILTPDDLTRPVIERYQQYLFHYRKKNGAPFSSRTQRKKLLHMKYFLSWLCKKHIIIYNPAADIELPRMNHTLPRDFMSVDEVELVISQADVRFPLGIRDRAIMETLYSTGLRRRELLHLAIYDIQFEQGYLFVREGKGRRDRVVPLGARALKWVDKYLREVRPHFAFPDDETLFVSSSGYPIDPESLSSLLKKYLRQSGVNKHGSCHIWRHTFATQLLDNGADIRHIQKMLGHVSLDTTEVYTHVAIHKLKQVHSMSHPAEMETPEKAAALPALEKPAQ